MTGQPAADRQCDRVNAAGKRCNYEGWLSIDGKRDCGKHATIVFGRTREEVELQRPPSNHYYQKQKTDREARKQAR